MFVPDREKHLRRRWPEKKHEILQITVGSSTAVYSPEFTPRETPACFFLNKS